MGSQSDTGVPEPAGSAEAVAHLRDVLRAAEQSGLLAGPRSVTVRGRMTPALVARAKERAGVTSDTELVELALANLAMADDYGEWLVKNRASVDPDIDLEF